MPLSSPKIITAGIQDDIIQSAYYVPGGSFENYKITSGDPPDTLRLKTPIHISWFCWVGCERNGVCCTCSILDRQNCGSSDGTTSKIAIPYIKVLWGHQGLFTKQMQLCNGRAWIRQNEARVAISIWLWPPLIFRNWSWGHRGHISRVTTMTPPTTRAPRTNEKIMFRSHYWMQPHANSTVPC